MKKEMFDVVVIGGGAAGFTAGLYAARRGLATVVLTKDLGGQAATTDAIENYPGTEFSDGPKLMQKFYDQARQHGAEVRFIEALGVRKLKDGTFSVRTPKGNISGAAVILGFGLTPRDLGVPGEARLKGKGVCYCTTCDGPLFKSKRIAVIGGGDDALASAEYLARISREVHLVYRTEKYRVDRALGRRIALNKKITVHDGVSVQKIGGSGRVQSLTVRHKGKELRLSVDGVFVEIGYVVNTAWLKGLVKLGKAGEIVTDKQCRTSCPGVFAAGDIANVDYKQIVISAGQGATAALEAYRYLAERSVQLEPDWGKK